MVEVFVACWIWAYPIDRHVPCDYEEGESIAEMKFGSEQ